MAAENQFPLASAAAAACVHTFFREQSRGIEVDWLNPTEQIFRDLDAKQMLFVARKSRDDGYDALAARLYDQQVIRRGNF